MTRDKDAGRRAPRVAVRIDASLAGRSNRKVRLVDLSMSGCLVQCEARLDPGAIFDLHLFLDADPLTAKVRVVEASLDGTSGPDEGPRYLAGLEFLSLAAREQNDLRRFIAEERRKRSAHPAAD